MVGALEGTVGHQRGSPIGGVELRHVGTNDVATHGAIMPLATPGLQQPRDTSLGLHAQLHHDVVEGGAMSPTRAGRDVHALFLRRLSAVIPAIARETRRIEMAARGRQPQAPGRRGGNEAGECRPPRRGQRIERAPERVIMEMAGLHAWGNEARERRSLAKMGDEVARVVEKTAPVEHQSCDGMASRHNAHGRVLLRRLVDDRGDAEFVTHACDQAQVIEDQRAVWLRLRRDVRTVRGSQSLLRCRGDGIDMPK